MIVAVAAITSGAVHTTHSGERLCCTLAPLPTHAVVQVERDTTLSLGVEDLRPAYSSQSSPDAPTAGPDTPMLAPASSLFALQQLLHRPLRTRPPQPGVLADVERQRRTRVMTWAAQHAVDAELEPVRSLVRQVVLEPDWTVAQRTPSRVRGTYRVEIEVDGQVLA
jgi:hypothetical protein